MSAVRRIASARISARVRSARAEHSSVSAPPRRAVNQGTPWTQPSSRPGRHPVEHHHRAATAPRRNHRGRPVLVGSAGGAWQEAVSAYMRASLHDSSTRRTACRQWPVPAGQSSRRGSRAGATAGPRGRRGNVRARILPKPSRKVQPGARRDASRAGTRVVRQLMSVVHSFGWRSGRWVLPSQKGWNGRKPCWGGGSMSVTGRHLCFMG